MTEKASNNSGLIYKAIPSIMLEIPSIYKDRKNEAQRYKFRGIDDVYNAVNPILAKHGVFMRADVQDVSREERPSKSGGVMAFVQVRVRYSFVAKDGSFVSTDSLGEGMDSGDKATPKAMSIAQKYAILQMFCIPTADSKDPENGSPEPALKPRRSEPDDDPLYGPDVNEPPKDKAAFRNITLKLSDGKEHKVTKFEAYNKFKNLKGAIGDEDYYELLGTFGYEHANEIPDKKLAAIYSVLLERLNQQEAAVPNE